MAQKKITDLTLIDQVTEELNIPGDDTIQTYRFTVAQLRAFLMPPGCMLDFGGENAPNGFLLCGGQAVSRSTYAALFAAIGTAYGTGDGSTTFNVPDYRGRVAVGKDNMGGSAASRMTTAGSGVDGATMGAAGGSQVHTLTSTQMPSHTHTQNAHAHDNGCYTYVDVNMQKYGHVGSTAARLASNNTSTTHRSGSTDSITATNNNTGGDGAHNNTQPSLICTKIIRF